MASGRPHRATRWSDLLEQRTMILPGPRDIGHPPLSRTPRSRRRAVPSAATASTPPGGRRPRRTRCADPAHWPSRRAIRAGGRRDEAESSSRDPPSGGRSITISQCGARDGRRRVTNSPCTDPVPSTSNPARRKNAVAEARSATVMPMWSKRRTCAHVIHPPITGNPVRIGLTVSECGRGPVLPRHQSRSAGGRFLAAGSIRNTGPKS